VDVAAIWQGEESGLPYAAPNGRCRRNSKGDGAWRSVALVMIDDRVFSPEGSMESSRDANASRISEKCAEPRELAVPTAKRMAQGPNQELMCTRAVLSASTVGGLEALKGPIHSKGRAKADHFGVLPAASAGSPLSGVDSHNRCVGRSTRRLSQPVWTVFYGVRTQADDIEPPRSHSSPQSELT
jgi:hypothetical protein